MFAHQPQPQSQLQPQPQPQSQPQPHPQQEPPISTGDGVVFRKRYPFLENGIITGHVEGMMVLGDVVWCRVLVLGFPPRRFMVPSYYLRLRV
jgi:hypothetical protein